MTKQIRTCPIHNKPLTYSRKHKTWYCKDCLYGSFLTYQAQQEAVKRYRQSEKGKKAERDYEQSVGGREARKRYLESEKYKQRRKEYNQRLKESLQIARSALAERATREKVEERQRTEELIPLIQDIREYLDVMGTPPTISEVTKWAETYGATLSPSKVTELINKARLRY